MRSRNEVSRARAATGVLQHAVFFRGPSRVLTYALRGKQTSPDTPPPQEQYRRNRQSRRRQRKRERDGGAARVAVRGGGELADHRVAPESDLPVRVPDPALHVVL